MSTATESVLIHKAGSKERQETWQRVDKLIVDLIAFTVAAHLKDMKRKINGNR